LRLRPWRQQRRHFSFDCTLKYEDLPGIFSPEDALLPDAARIHETETWSGRDSPERRPRKGAEGTRRWSSQTPTGTQWPKHAYLNPEAGRLQAMRRVSLTVWMPSKTLTRTARSLRSFFRTSPPDKVRIIQCNESVVNFSETRPLCLPATMPARRRSRPKKPAKMVLYAGGSFFGQQKAPSLRVHHTTRSTRDGRLLAVESGNQRETPGPISESGPNVLQGPRHATGRL